LPLHGPPSPVRDSSPTSTSYRLLLHLQARTAARLHLAEEHLVGDNDRGAPSRRGLAVAAPSLPGRQASALAHLSPVEAPRRLVGGRVLEASNVGRPGHLRRP
jgi:hypothetical protein